MLVLSRKPGDTVVIDGSIKVTVIELRGNMVRLGVEAPRDVRVRREELAARIQPPRRALASA
jgi:carbon storage regulator